MAAKKAPGKDHITKEMLTTIWYPLSNFLADFFTLCYTWGWTPANFRSALVVPIFKKGDHTLPSNYRPISLTTTFRKIYERCLQPALLDSMPALDVAQGGFRASRGSVDQTFNLMALQQQFKQLYGEDASLCMLDQKAAYDSLSRKIIFKRLYPHLPKPLFHTLRNLFNMVTSEVVIKNAFSSPILPTNGVLQGSILSPFLYAVFINELPMFLRTVPTRFPLFVDVAVKFNDNTSSTDTLPLSLDRAHYGEYPLTESEAAITEHDGVLRKTTAIHMLCYADDVCIIAHKRDMPLLIQMVEDFSNMFNFKWNPQKCALINYTSSRRPISIYGISLPIVVS